MATSQGIRQFLAFPQATITQRFYVRVATLASPLSVLDFELEEGFNQTYRADITVTSVNPAIAGAACVGRRATFTIEAHASLPAFPGLLDPASEPIRTVHGVVTQWELLKTSEDEGTYRLHIEPRFALLRQVHDSAVFLNKTVQELITESIVDREFFEPYDVEFQLEDPPEHVEQALMYEETVENFVSRHCRRAGYYFYFKQELDPSSPRRDTIVFGDGPSGYMRALEVPLRPESGLAAADREAVLTLTTRRQLVPGTVELWDRNYRTPHTSLTVDATIAHSDDRSVFGGIHRSAEHHHNPEIGKRLAKSRREECIARQTVFTGTSNVGGMMPGMVVRLTNHTLDGAEHGFVITRLVTRASRSSGLINTFEAVPSLQTCRPEYDRERHWRQVPGTLIGEIESGDNQPYAWLDEYGRYRVKFLFARRTGKRGLNSMPLRLLRTNASYEGGLHSPLLPGTEVRLAATNGDIDRLYIAGALHDDAHPDVVHGKDDWYSRAVWRSPLLSGKLRFDDMRGREGAKFATTYAKTSVSIGYLVDNKKKRRGEGLEASTEGWGTVHAAKGLLLSADALSTPNAPHLEMHAALRELRAALQRVNGLVEATARATGIPADQRTQAALLETLDELKGAGLIASAPEGIALTTPRSIQQAAGENVLLTAGNHVDVSVVKRFTLAAGDLISLCAHKLGIRLFAAKGKVEIQAQADDLDLLAKRQVLVASECENVLVTGRSKAVMSSGGAAVTLENGGIVISCPGQLRIKAASVVFEGPSSVNTNLPSLPSSDLSISDFYNNSL